MISTSCKKISTVRNPSGGPLPRGESPEEAVIRGPCPSPCSPWRLPLLAAGALARRPPATARTRAAGCFPAAAAGFPAAACGFPTATAGTSRERGGPPTSAAAGFASAEVSAAAAGFASAGLPASAGAGWSRLGGGGFAWGAASLGTRFAECRLAQRLHLLSMCLAAVGLEGP